MKRLLALLLCLMLFVSVIPTSAFAAVDLSPAYEAQKALNNAYAQLAAATVAKNGYDAFSSYAKFFGTDTKAGAGAQSAAIAIAQSAKKYVKIIRDRGTGLSYENLFVTGAKNLNTFYNKVGTRLVTDCKNAEIKAAADAVKAYTDAKDEVLANVGTAIANALAAMVIPTA